MHNSGIDSPLDSVEDTPYLEKYQKIEDKLEKYDGMTARKKLADIVLKNKPYTNLVLNLNIQIGDMVF